MGFRWSEICFFYVRLCIEQNCLDTFPKFNMEPENRPSQKETHLPASFSRVYVNLPGSTQKWHENGGSFWCRKPMHFEFPNFLRPIPGACVLILPRVFVLGFVMCWMLESFFFFEVSLANQKLRFKPARMQSFGDMPWACWMICTSRSGRGSWSGESDPGILKGQTLVFHVDLISICILYHVCFRDVFFLMKLFWAFMI